MAAFTVERHDDVGRYATVVAPVLTGDPLTNNVIATLLAARSTGETPLEPGLLLLSVSKDALLVGAAIQTPPRGALLTPMPRGAAAALAQWMCDQHPGLPSANGPVASVDEFASAFAAATRRGASVEVQQRMFAVDRVQPPTNVRGRARPASSTERDLLVEWAFGFHLDTTAQAAANRPPTIEYLSAPIDQRLRSKNLLWLWEVDGQPCSVCWLSKPTANVVRVSGVYTPPDHRGHGYASANVAHATQYALDHLAPQCMLYTDLANPTSNKIYQAIGYRSFGDARQWGFGSAWWSV